MYIILEGVCAMRNIFHGATYIFYATVFFYKKNIFTLYFFLKDQDY